MQLSGWSQWQSDIVAVIRTDYRDLFPLIRSDEIDWGAWKPLYDQGCSARGAVEQALSGGAERSARTAHH
jgi:hypothetical protein